MRRQKSRSRGKIRSRQRIPQQKQKADSILTLQLPRPEINNRVEVVLVPNYSPPDPRASIQISREGSRGSYLVTFVLSLPGKNYFLDDIDLNQILLSGDSPLAVPVVAEKLTVRLFRDQEPKEVIFFLNDQNRLSKVQVQLEADNLLFAEAVAFNAVMPILSRWSFLYDVSLDIVAYQVLEERTEVQKWMYTVLGKIKTLDINERGFSKPQYRTLFAAYREGTLCLHFLKGGRAEKDTMWYHKGE